MRASFPGIFQQRQRIELFGSFGSVITVLGNYTEASNLTPNTGNFFTPCVYYDTVTGRTYIPYQRRIDEKPYGQTGLIVYDPDKGLDRPHTVGKQLAATDTHTIPNWGIDVDGNIYSFQENLHITPLDIYKNRYADDYTVFDELAEKAGTDVAYAQIMKHPDDDNYTIYGRKGSDYRAGALHSNDGLEDWDAMFYIVGTPPANSRLYGTSPFTYQVGAWYYLEVTVRNDADNSWHRKYMMKTPSTGSDRFVRFYNINESFSKDIVASGVITDTELQANYLVFDAGSISRNAHPPVSDVSPTGTYYTITSDGLSVGMQYYFKYWNGSSWEHKTITDIPDLLDNEAVTGSTLSQGSAFMQMIAYSDNLIEVFARVQDGAYIKVHRYKTTDQGDSWEFIEDPFDSVNENIWIAQFPHNIKEIPRNQNFVCVGGEYSASQPIDIYFRKQVFGTPQSEPNSIVIPSISDPTTVTDCLAYYKAAAADLALSGTNVTSFTDKTGNARTLTTAGNPQWDSVNSEVVFDGTDDIATLVPDATMLAMDEGTIIYVSRGTTVGYQMGFSNTANNSSWWAIGRGIGSGSTVFAHRLVHSTTDFSIQGQDATNDNNPHVMAVKIHQNFMYLYVDGVLQYWEPVNMTATERGMVGTFVVGLTSPNRFAIGGIRRLTILYAAMRFRECAMYNRALSHEELMGVTKGMATRHSVTLGDQYQ